MTRSAFIDPRQLEALAGTKLRARSIIEGLMAGMHRNPNRGSSVEFAEYKEYGPGDELRHIDWRAYARVDRYYVKQFEDETNLRAFFLVDQSGSMGFAYDGVMTKYDYAATLAASLAWLLLQQGDAPGLQLFHDQPGVYLAPSSKRTQLDDFCALLDAATPQGKTRSDLAVARIAERIRARSLVVLISDFIDTGEETLTLAKILRRRGMEVVLFHIMDRAEWTLPWEQMCLFEGMEGEGESLAEPDEIRSAYKTNVRAYLDQLAQECASADLEYFHLYTDQPVEEAILALTQKRRRGRG